MCDLRPVCLLLVLFAVGVFAQSKPTATLTASDSVKSASVGASVAISGSTVAAGGVFFVNGQAQRVVYVFTKPTTAPWTDETESARLIGGGSSVAISGDGSVIVTVEVGSQVLIFLRPAAGWTGTITPTTVLTLSPPPTPWTIQGHLQGLSMNATGTTIVAGAPDAGHKAHFHDGVFVPAVPNLGAAYVWIEPGNGWASATGVNQTATLTASDGVAQDSFGTTVGVSANTIVAGAAGALSSDGAAYLFQRPATGWLKLTSKFTAKFTASDGLTGDRLGSFVAVGESGTLVAAGTVRGCPGSPGPAYVFAKPTSGWSKTATQSAELTASDGGDCFGQGLAVVKDLVVVGAPTTGGNAQPGADYTFAKPSKGWTDMSLPASMVGGIGSVHFGISNSIGGRTIAVGAPETTVNGTASAGAVYLFSN